MNICNLFLLIKRVFVAIVNIAAMSSFTKTGASAWSGFWRPVWKGGVLATFLVGWPQLLPECLCQQQKQTDFSLGWWAPGCSEAQFVILCLLEAKPAEMYKHIILFDQRETFFWPLHSCMTSPFTALVIPVSWRGEKKSPKVLKSSALNRPPLGHPSLSFIQTQETVSSRCVSAFQSCWVS